MAAGPESRLVAAMVKAIQRTYPGALALKIAGGPYQVAGIPDLFIVLDGRLIALEVKAPRPGESREASLGRVTERQWAMIGRLRAAGATAEVVLTVEEALAVLKKVSTSF